MGISLRVNVPINLQMQLNPSPSYGSMQEQLNVVMSSPSLAQSALGSQGLLRQGSGTASITYQWTVGIQLYALINIPLHENPFPVYSGLQIQVKSPLDKLSLVQSALISQGLERQGLRSTRGQKTVKCTSFGIQTLSTQRATDCTTSVHNRATCTDM